MKYLLMLLVALSTLPLLADDANYWNARVAASIAARSVAEPLPVINPKIEGPTPFKTILEPLPTVNTISQEEKTKPEIPLSEKYKVTQLSKRSCVPCKVANKALSDALQNNKLPFQYSVIYLNEDDPKSVPEFYWDSPKGRFQIVGWYGVEHLVNEWVKTTGVSKDGVTSPGSLPYKKAATPQKQSNNYTPSWTWPGNLSQHLQGTHGINTSGMSQDQMEQTHDNAHESTRRGHR